MKANGQLHAPAVLFAQKEHPVYNGYEAGWISEPSGCGGKEKISAPCRVSKSCRQKIASHYTHWCIKH